MNNKKMDYNEIRNAVEKMGNENYRDLIKALVSFEKGINDEDALEKLYAEFMESDTKGLLHEDFDYMIDELREQGGIDDTIEFVPDKDDFVTAVGNMLKDVEIIERVNKNQQKFKVANLTLVSGEGEEKFYTNASAFGDKIANLKNFKKGDFVKLTGHIKISKGENGKEFKNLRVVSSKLLKAKEQMKDQTKDNEKLKDEIAELKSQIEERKLDHHYADSFEQAAQITEDIKGMEDRLAILEGTFNNKVVNNKIADKDYNHKNVQDITKESVLGAIKKYQAEDKEKPKENKETLKEAER